MIFSVLRIVNLCADDVGGQEIGRELDAMERGLDCRRQRADTEGFREAGHAFEQDMPIGEQADQQPVHQLFLPDDDAADFGAQSFDPAGRSRHLFVQRIAHAGVNLGRAGEGLKLSARPPDDSGGWLTA